MWNSGIVGITSSEVGLKICKIAAEIIHWNLIKLIIKD